MATDDPPHLLTLNNNNNNNNTTNLTSGGVDSDLSFQQMSPEGQQCMKDFWDSLPLDGIFCNATWDSLHCWPATKEGVIVAKACGDVFNDYPSLNEYPHGMSSVYAFDRIISTTNVSVHVSSHYAPFTLVHIFQFFL
ncbi:hypothetical protein Pcinc_024125 [Petrolisthes cinctipes]|uniref:G-protein coupled receptors family 2 profile 1 domain-containing protein n=1 Tax=Petrolisthes cinctipes TaxID=88211 RepID=A0AAE1KFR7_PETCI|nr:hypothetical protein Pcinc_024125 [Petrolisthes cinctipes]